MKKLLRIEAFTGIGAVNFGSSISEALVAVDLCDGWVLSIGPVDDGAPVNLELAGKLRLSFSLDSGYLLDGIEVLNNDFVDHPTLMIGASASDVIKIVDPSEVKKIDVFINDKGDVLKWIDIVDIGVQVLFINDVLNSVTYYPRYNSEDFPVWPSAKS